MAARAMVTGTCCVTVVVYYRIGKYEKAIDSQLLLTLAHTIFISIIVYEHVSVLQKVILYNKYT